MYVLEYSLIFVYLCFCPNTEGVDYQMNEVCCYEGNSREANCPIHILKDNLDEEEESFEVVLSSSHESQLVCTGQKATIRVKIGNISPTPDGTYSLLL